MGVSSYIEANESKVESDTIVAIGDELAKLRSVLSLYCMLGMGVTYHEPYKRIKAITKHYEKTVASIRSGFSSAEIGQLVDGIDEPWKRFKAKLLTRSEDEAEQKKNALFVHDNIRSVLSGLEKTKAIILKSAKGERATYIDAAIEIGASAKRLSSHYLMRLWKLDDPTIEEHWNKGVKRYQKGIDMLKKSPYVKDETFAKQLTECEKNLRFFEMMNTMSRGAPVSIDKKSDHVLKLSKSMLETILKSN
jgi:hypothetical protein